MRSQDYGGEKLCLLGTPELHLDYWRLSYVSEGCMLLALLRCGFSRISHRLKSVVHIEVVVYELSGI